MACVPGLRGPPAQAGLEQCINQANSKTSIFAAMVAKLRLLQSPLSLSASASLLKCTDNDVFVCDCCFGCRHLPEGQLLHFLELLSL